MGQSLYGSIDTLLPDYVRGSYCLRGFGTEVREYGRNLFGYGRVERLRYVEIVETYLRYYYRRETGEIRRSNRPFPSST